MQYFRTIILTAKNNGWITADPFHNYKITFKKVDRGYLMDEELQKLMQKSFTIERLEHVRDLFIFCCFTGIVDKKRREEKEGNRLIVRNECPYLSLSAE
jgi:hypothetical protein